MLDPNRRSPPAVAGNMERDVSVRRRSATGLNPKPLATCELRSYLAEDELGSARVEP